jgi:hypothetical protein
MKKQQFPLEELTFEQYKNEFGKIHIPSIDRSDSLTEIHSQDSLDIFINDFLTQWRYTEVIFNPNGVWFDRIKIVNDDFNLAHDNYLRAKSEWCRENTNE